MDTQLSLIAHSLARLCYMRDQDLAAHRDEGEKVLRAREEWRLVREESVCKDLLIKTREFEGQCSAGQHQPMLPSVAAAVDDALATSLGLTADYIQRHPFNDWASEMFDLKQPHMRSLVSDEKKTSAQKVIVSAILEQHPPFEGRESLQDVSRVFLSGFTVWWRYTEHLLCSGKPSAVSLVLTVQKFLAKRRTAWVTSMEAMSMHGMLKRSPQKKVLKKKSAQRSVNSSVVGSEPSSVAPSPQKISIAPDVADPVDVTHRVVSEDYWSRAAAHWLSFAGMDAVAVSTKKWLHLEKSSRLLSRVTAKLQLAARRRRTRSKRKQALHRLCTEGLEKLSNQMKPLQEYLQLADYVQREETRAKLFFETEEKQFNAQFKEYTQKMTHFYLHECPLDRGWMAKFSGEVLEDGTKKVVFINTATGKIQDENPNMLKVVAAKNRQLLKANAARQDRVRVMQRHVDALNKIKTTDVPRVESMLSGEL